MKYTITIHYQCERCRGTVSFKKDYAAEHKVRVEATLPPMLGVLDCETKRVQNELLEFVHECPSYKGDNIKKFGLCRFIGYDDEREEG